MNEEKWKEKSEKKKKKKEETLECARRKSERSSAIISGKRALLRKLVHAADSTQNNNNKKQRKKKKRCAHSRSVCVCITDQVANWFFPISWCVLVADDEAIVSARPTARQLFIIPQMNAIFTTPVRPSATPGEICCQVGGKSRKMLCNWHFLVLTRTHTQPIATRHVRHTRELMDWGSAVSGAEMGRVTQLVRGKREEVSF